MIIDDKWEIEDKVSGLRIKIVKGKTQNRLQVERFAEPIVNNRDFWFTSEGMFDGTGSGCA